MNRFRTRIAFDELLSSYLTFYELKKKFDFYKNNKLIKSKKINKDDHFKNMFNFFHKCCFKKDLRLSENFEFLHQAKTLNEIFLKNKKLFKKK